MIQIEHAYGITFVLINTKHEQVLAKGGKDQMEVLLTQYRAGEHPEFDFLYSKKTADERGGGRVAQ